MEELGQVKGWPSLSTPVGGRGGIREGKMVDFSQNLTRGV